jgi:hypothetical protein
MAVSARIKGGTRVLPSVNAGGLYPIYSGLCKYQSHPPKQEHGSNVQHVVDVGPNHRGAGPSQLSIKNVVSPSLGPPRPSRPQASHDSSMSSGPHDGGTNVGTPVGHFKGGTEASPLCKSRLVAQFGLVALEIDQM